MQSLHVQYTNDGIRRFPGVGWQVDGLDLNRDSQWSQMPALDVEREVCRLPTKTVGN